MSFPHKGEEGVRTDQGGKAQQPFSCKYQSDGQTVRQSEILCGPSPRPNFPPSAARQPTAGRLHGLCRPTLLLLQCTWTVISYSNTIFKVYLHCKCTVFTLYLQCIYTAFALLLLQGFHKPRLLLQHAEKKMQNDQINAACWNLRSNSQFKWRLTLFKIMILIKADAKRYLCNDICSLKINPKPSWHGFLSDACVNGVQFMVSDVTSSV